MKFYRIKQIAENKFIPQKADSIISLLFNSWDGIQVIELKPLIWYTKKLQASECSVGSLEEAKNVIKIYRGRIKVDKKYPKYHKV